MTKNETVFSDVTVFQDYMKKHHLHNQFEATMYISQMAREYQKAYPDLTEKEAISWVLRGHPSDSYIKKASNRRTNEKIAEMKFDMLSYIDDPQVRSSCEKSISQSVTHKAVMFVYDDDLTPEQKARVRIITKLTFDQI